MSNFEALKVRVRALKLPQVLGYQNSYLFIKI